MECTRVPRYPCFKTLVCLFLLWQTSKSFLCSCRVSPGRSVCKSKSEKVLHHKTLQTENSPQLEVSYKSPTYFTIWTNTFLKFSCPSQLVPVIEFPNNPYFMVFLLQRLSCRKIRINSNLSTLERSDQISDLGSDFETDL